MYRNRWELGDAFQVLSKKEGYKEQQVLLYGVFTKNGSICIAKTNRLPESEDENGDKKIKWRITVDTLSTIEEGYPGAIHIDIHRTHLPYEVSLVLTALTLSEKPYEEMSTLE
jgi:hypothetical protein